jgi:hypothetical protein
VSSCVRSGLSLMRRGTYREQSIERCGGVSETVSVHRLTGLSALTALVDLAGASVATGAIARRRVVVGLLERRQADRRSIDRLHALRRRHGDGPVELVLPGRRFLVPLVPRDVGRILDGAPSPFHPASWEKRRALDKFQPHAVLITRGPLRAPRRALNEAALDTHAELHHLAGPFSAIIEEEAEAFCAETLRRGSLTSAQFTIAWWKLVRRLVLGESARDDDAITDDLWRLRRAGNWSFAAPTHARWRARFAERIYRYAEDADPTSLLGALAKVPAAGELDPMGQLPHWLFAFDAASMATIRAMALIATHPDAQQRCETAEPDVPQLPPVPARVRAGIDSTVTPTHCPSPTCSPRTPGWTAARTLTPNWCPSAPAQRSVRARTSSSSPPVPSSPRCFRAWHSTCGRPRSSRQANRCPSR